MPGHPHRVSDHRKMLRRHPERVPERVPDRLGGGGQKPIRDPLRYLDLAGLQGPAWPRIIRRPERPRKA